MARSTPWTRGQSIASLLLATTVLAGCGSGGGSSTTPPSASTGLMQALATVKATAGSRSYFAWADLSATRRLAGLPTQPGQVSAAKLKSRWDSEVGTATNNLETADQAELTAKTSINLLRADQAVQIGVPADTATRINGSGIDPSAVTRSLRRLGARQVSAAGQTFLAFGAEHSVNVNGPLADMGLTTQLDRSIARNHTLYAGSAVAPVLALLGGSPSLAADPAHKAAAGCLGTVITAVISTPASVGAFGSSAELVAIGNEQPPSASAPVTEILCMIDANGNAAGRQLALLRRFDRSAQIHGTGEPTAEVVRSFNATPGKADGFTVVRAVIGLRPSQSADFLERLEAAGEIGDLIGGATRNF